MRRGEIVNGLSSKMWIERYDKAGEFQFTALASTEIRDLLPIGSFVSHVDTKEIMMVENHEISDDRDKETTITISGRGLETFFDHRIVGSNKTFPATGQISDIVLAADYTWNQAVALLSTYLLTANLVDDNDAFPYLSIMTDIAGTGISQPRTVKRGGLYSRLLELLVVESIGIKVIRPGPWSPLGAASQNTAVVIHKGVDRTKEVMFSYDTGEIESADYLWSNKKFKNTAYVTGKWVETLVTTTAVELDRRMMHVDASDLDQAWSVPPVGTDLANILAKMQQRGLEALAAQNDVALTKAEVSRNINQDGYRIRFDVGDIITVQGNYNESTIMRISEYVEIEDQHGRIGYPTLTTV